jgi:P4 family phage/plasmid primase-like protien
MATTASKPVFVDFSIGEVPLIKIEEKSPEPKSFVYTIHVKGPDGLPFMPPVEIENPASAKSIEWVVTRAMSTQEGFAYGLDDRPYLWAGNHWVESENWMTNLSTSIDALINTGALSTRASKCFYNRMRAVWAMQNRPRLALKPFGLCMGIPLSDKVLIIKEDGGVDLVDHKPEHQNMRFLPIAAQDVIDEFLEFHYPRQKEPLLFQFFRTTLSPDQLTTIQRWFGMHLVLHQIGRPQKMLYMHGSGGNGKGVIVDLLKCLITADAVADLRLRDLQKSSNIELLVGKLAMIGAESSAETDNEALKSIVSMETVSIDPKYRDPYNFTPACLVTQASNFEPHFDDESDAMVRRVIALDMTFKPKTDDDVIPDIMEKVRTDEYALLIAFALQGAMDVVKAGTIVVPVSVKEHSEHVVRKVSSVDRFMDIFEYGNFEVAEEELYVGYTIYCKRQQLKVIPKREFYKGLVTRLDRKHTPYDHRERAPHYVAQVMISERNTQVLLAPQIKELETVPIYLGFRIREGEFGPPIGQAIPKSRRDVSDYVHLASLS